MNTDVFRSRLHRCGAPRRLAACTLVLVFAAGLQAARAASPDCAALYQQLDTQHHEALDSAGNNRTAALRAVEQAVFDAFAACPEDGRFYVLMGDVQISLGQISLAVAYGMKAVNLAPQDWRAHQLLGSTLAMGGDAEHGVAELRQAAELSGGNSRVRLNLASALVWASRFKEAAPLLDELVKDPDKVVAGAAYHLRGKVRLSEGKVREGSADFERALDLGYKTERFEIPRSVLERDDNPSP